MQDEKSRAGSSSAFVACSGANTGAAVFVVTERVEVVAQRSLAAERGANAVVGMCFDAGKPDSAQGYSMAEITALGTTVIPESAGRNGIAKLSISPLTLSYVRGVFARR